MLRRTIPILYWIAIGMLAIGALVLATDGDNAALDHVGEIVAGLAWPVAAVGALLDTIRHQRRQGPGARHADAATGTGAEGAEGPRTPGASTPGRAADGPRLRSEE